MYKLARIAMLMLVMKELEMPRITEHRHAKSYGTAVCKLIMEIAWEHLEFGSLIVGFR